MAKFGPRNVQRWSKKFCHNLKLLYLILNHKLGLKNKNWQTNISRLEEIGQKWSKTLNLSPQAMFFGQKGQNGQNQNCNKHKTTVKWFKAIDLSFWLSYMKFWSVVFKKTGKNLIFEQKLAKFWTKKVQKWSKRFFVTTQIYFIWF